MNQGKMETVKWNIVNITVLRISELKWTGTEYFQSDNFKICYSRNDKSRRNRVSLIQGSIGSWHSQARSIRLHVKPINIAVKQLRIWRIWNPVASHFCAFVIAWKLTQQAEGIV